MIVHVALDICSGHSIGPENPQRREARAVTFSLSVSTYVRSFVIAKLAKPAKPAKPAKQFSGP